MMTYPLVDVFATVQGEGSLLGVPMIFVRLAGCSVGCAQCDTDYRARSRATVAEIAQRVEALGSRPWVWVTGGEPADYDLAPLLQELRNYGRIALATSGRKSLGGAGHLIDFLSVSPHGWDDGWLLRRGSQINVVPGLNGVRLDDMPADAGRGFAHRWVTPLWDWPESLRQCLSWVEDHPDWRLGIQAHRHWELP